MHLNIIVSCICIMLVACTVRNGQAYAQVKSEDGLLNFAIAQDHSSGDLHFDISGNERLRIKSSTGGLILQKGVSLKGATSPCSSATKAIVHYSCGQPVYCDGVTWKPWPPGAQKREEKLLAFVSSVAVRGDAASVTALDAQCNQLAATAGIKRNFRAWVSEPASPIASRFQQSACTHKYYLVDGITKIADDFNDLTDGSLDSAWNKDEYGALYSGDVWTGSSDSGVATPQNCSAWQSGSSAVTGTKGSTAVLAGWSDSGTASCDNDLRFLCIEQP